MGIFFEPVEARAAAQALELAQGLALPVSARSRPTGEMRSKGCVLNVLIIFIGLVVAAVLAAVLAGLGGGLRGTIGLVLVVLVGLVAIDSIRRGLKAGFSSYVDPELTIEAGSTGVTFKAPGGSRILAYDQVQAEIAAMAVRTSVRFVGLTLKSPLGPIKLDDAHFVNGRAAAAAIVARMRRDSGIG